MFAAPAKSRGEYGQCLAFFFAELFEEAFYERVCFPRAAADEEWDGGADGSKESDAGETLLVGFFVCGEERRTLTSG